MVEYLSLASVATAGVVWAIRLEGKVNGHDQLFQEREKQATERHDELKDRLVRIENKLDLLSRG